MKFLRDITAMVRPHQWIKNLFIFPALIFSKNLFHPVYFFKSLAAFVLFCMLAGSVYIINDIMDVNEDRHHPQKKRRPIASGSISVGTAYVLHVALAAVSLVLCFLLNFQFGLISAFYYAMNLGYSFGLKRVVILDVFIVSIGFVLRAVAGGLVISVSISPWLIICTMLLALFVVLAKRRHEIILMGDRANMLMELSLAAEDEALASRFRHSLDEYNPYFLDQLIGVTTATTLVTYIMYTLSADAVEKFGGTGLVYTVPFVIYGIFRYLYLIHLKKEGGNPAKVIASDAPMLVNILLWGIAVVVYLYKF
jgi:4-hydroxybenzoate polyprenyltransferase